MCIEGHLQCVIITRADPPATGASLGGLGLRSTPLLPPSLLLPLLLQLALLLWLMLLLSR